MYCVIRASAPSLYNVYRRYDNVYRRYDNVYIPIEQSMSWFNASGNFDQVEVDKFLEESLKMSRFKHAHVMGLIGVCLDAGSAPYIVMPFMANGSLLQYLKKERNKLVFTKDAEEDEV